MKTTYIGGVPRNWRDHGVFTEGNEFVGHDVTTIRQAAIDRVDKLSRTKDELDERISAAGRAAQAGNDEELAGVDLSALARDSARVSRELTEAREELEQSEARIEQEAATKRRKKFAETIARARVERTEFERLFSETCLALGKFCASVEEATTLVNSLATQLGTPLELRNELQALAEAPNPMAACLESGLKPTEQYGWNLGFQVIPLHELERTDL